MIDPFHSGERTLQRLYGAREQLAGSRAIQTALPAGFQRFLSGLDFVVVGTADEDRRPWASILFGRAGFLTAASATLVRIDAVPRRDDPAFAGLRMGAPVALLAIDLARRARIRVNGHVAFIDDGSITVEVGQAYGNCPQYIWPRKVTPPDGQPDRIADASFGSEEVRSIIEAADTFFIATQSGAEDGGDAMDVSHRGGPSGFVRCDETSLSWPDYRGNSYFNTLGNILTNPACGLLFADAFGTELLMLTGTAVVEDFDGSETVSPDGLATLGRVRFEPTSIVRRSLASHWRLTGEPAIIPRP